MFSIETHADTGRGEPGPMLVWRLPEPLRAVSSAMLGGGIREIDWVINAHVRSGYSRMDPDRHLREIASAARLNPDRGMGLMTAARVESVATGFSPDESNPVVATGPRRSTLPPHQHGRMQVRCDATVGVSYPTWAAAPDHPEPHAEPWTPSNSGGSRYAPRPGTINLVCFLPAPLTDAALVGAVITATEAKTQALIEGGLPGTGTASDAIVVCCPTTGGPVAPFAGPRSTWGAHLARAVHRATSDGLADYIARRAE